MGLFQQVVLHNCRLTFAPLRGRSKGIHEKVELPVQVKQRKHDAVRSLSNRIDSCLLFKSSPRIDIYPCEAQVIEAALCQSKETLTLGPGLGLSRLKREVETEQGGPCGWLVFFRGCPCFGGVQVNPQGTPQFSGVPQEKDMCFPFASIEQCCRHNLI